MTGPGRYHCEHRTARTAMAYVTAGRENSAALRIYHADHGSGSPVVRVHGYALTGPSREKQEAALLPGRAPGDHRRPAGLRRLEPAGHRLRPRHAGRRPSRAAPPGSTCARIPVLVIHGDQDRVLPYEATGSRLPALLKNARSTVIAGAPHALIWTHADEVNQALLAFIGHPGQVGRGPSGPEDRPQSGSENGRAG